MRAGFIDWTEERISLHILETNAGRHRLVDTVSMSLEGQLTQPLLASLVKGGIEKVYLSIPVGLLSLRELSFPFSHEAKIRETIAYELEGLLMGDPGDYLIDYFLTGQSENSNQVLAACIEKTRLKEIIDLFSSVGLDPVVITSLDLRLSRGNVHELLREGEVDDEVRSETAARELSEPVINLRRDELAYEGDVRKIRRSARVTGILILLLLIVIGTGFTLKLALLKKENNLLRAEVGSLYRDAFPGEAKIVDVVRQFRANLNSLKKRYAVLAGIPVLDTLLRIAEVQGEDVTLGEFSADGRDLLIRGSAVSFEDVDAFREDLSSSFSEVRVMDSTLSPDKEIVFSISMQEKGR